jgi:hypothetical protein
MMQMHALALKMIGLGQIEAAKNIADSQLDPPAPACEQYQCITGHLGNVAWIREFETTFIIEDDILSFTFFFSRSVGIMNEKRVKAQDVEL